MELNRHHPGMHTRTYYSLLLIIFCLSCITVSSYASLLTEDGVEITSDKIPAYLESYAWNSDDILPASFFYSTGCHSCKDALQYLKSFEKKHPDIRIAWYDLAYHPENRELFTEFKNQFHNYEISYPVLFIGTIGLSGGSDIIQYTSDIISRVDL